MTRIGKFEQADTGTIFLDEIGEMKASLQAKLLHVLQDAQFTKLGSNKPITVDVRIVAATNRDLEAMMLRSEFREDLYYRLKVIEVTVPPLPRAAPGDFASDALLHGSLRPPLQPADARAVARSGGAVPVLRVAGQHPRAGEHDQADRDPPGRAARHSRNDAFAARDARLRCRDRSHIHPWMPTQADTRGRRGRRGRLRGRTGRSRRQRAGVSPTCRRPPR